MTADPHRSRRRLLALSGSALAASLAGCSGSDTDDADDDGQQQLRPEDWEGVSEIRLDGYTRNWVGVEPDPIEGVTNPTLLLFEGEEYDLIWENKDGVGHNVELWDTDDDIVGDYSTPQVARRGTTQTLSFEADSEMHAYVCRPHRRMMIGYLAIEA